MDRCLQIPHVVLCKAIKASTNSSHGFSVSLRGERQMGAGRVTRPVHFGTYVCKVLAFEK